MTVLKEFQRLETTGVWHASPQDQRRDVIVQLGDATLTILAVNTAVLSHWSLPAIVRLNPGESPALFGPGTENTEILEIEDATMVAAIEKVHAAIERRRPKPGRLRHGSIVLVCLAVLALAVFWLPGALIRQAVAVVPTAKRVEIGSVLLTNMRRVSGKPCETPLGRQALNRMRARLLPDGRGRLVVLPQGVRGSTHLPGGIILLARGLVEDYDDPVVVAGFVLAEAERAAQQDPLGQMLKSLGIGATVRLLTTGKLSEATLDGYAETLLTAPPVALPIDPLLARFAAAAVPASPYAYALDITGETVLPLIEADPVPLNKARPVLADGDWISLQEICSE